MRFVSEYFITNNATKSYLAAGYNCSEESARRAGSRLLSRVDIQAALVHLDKQVQESALVSKRNVIESIQKTRATAEKEGGTANLRVVSECDRLLAQIKGMFKDKVEHSGEIIATVSEWRKITKEAKEAEVLEAKNNA
jgi:phage terminase small subunit